ncbi:unnamed protein product [Cutaneotrichosporon oleaginosum]
MVKYGTYTIDAPPPFQGRWRAIVDRLHYHFQFVRLQLLGCGDCRELIFKPDGDAYLFSRCRHHKGFYDGFCPFAATRYVFDDGAMHARRLHVGVKPPEVSEDEVQKPRPESLVIPLRASPEPMNTAERFDMYAAPPPPATHPRTQMIAAVRVSIDGTEPSRYSQCTSQTIATEELRPDSARPYSPFSDSHEPLLIHKETRGTAAVIDSFPAPRAGLGPPKDSSGVLPSPTPTVTASPLPLFPVIINPPSAESSRGTTPASSALHLQLPGLRQPPSPPPQTAAPAVALLTPQISGAASPSEALTALETQLTGALGNARLLHDTLEWQASTIAAMSAELERTRSDMARLRAQHARLRQFREEMFEAFGLHDPEEWDVSD